MMTDNTSHQAYRVLARKYRPRHFDELIGQDALVRTLRNAIESGRIAHAFMLTGVRGVGKTTTARIIAKALNYTGPNGAAGPTTGPTDDCEICRAIAEDRHPDVMEMDAASRTGVDDIREILDGVRYAPVSARYKIYIIDEVHMLSKNAFNALLKTLEEPPPHVKFIFATTEIRKVPVTVLSRCQRFDLKRVDIATLADHYRNICVLEKVQADDDALTMIARAADGSVRDGLSLLDQAIALSSEKVRVQQVRDMLGLSDRSRVLDMLEAALKGECATALAIMDDMARSGADSLVVVQDLLELTHLLTRYRAVPGLLDKDNAAAPDMKTRLQGLSVNLSMPSLGRAWQLLLKGVSEIQSAPQPRAALEMLLIRLAYTSDLPDPGDLMRKIRSGESIQATGAGHRASESRIPEPVALRAVAGGGAVALAAPPPAIAEEAVPLQAGTIVSLQTLELSLRQRGYSRLAADVYHYVRMGRIEEGRLEISYDQSMAPTMLSDLSKALKEMTGLRWLVTETRSPVVPTLHEQQQLADRALLAEAQAHPVVASVVKLFPGATIRIKTEQ
ncbi:MAG: DNA polymerase III subunit gamma/tau [Micavibrio aeruginosavorus]|uniref:DNA polymerase III subunit gamma/tau n=1 Tax=Micavibrio aeruginosavorus TaxID=349221 RepID=A0A7T5R4H2_9BACT|nr:MAG: DNA polymerase III subunit gamma/tau [Micavibrio aeruginosavorus]